MLDSINTFVLWIPGWYYALWIAIPVFSSAILLMASMNISVPLGKWEYRWLLSSFAGPVPMVLIWICVFAVLLVRLSFPKEDKQ